MDKETTLYPAYKQASLVIRQMNLAPGATLTNRVIRELLGYKVSKGTTLEEWQKEALMFMGDSTALRRTLLNDYQMAFKTVRGEGWELLPPNGQTEYALTQVYREVGKAVNRSLQIMANTDTSQLSAKELQENTNGLARMSQLRQIISNERSIDFAVFKRKELGAK